jgi:hypothetical protein
MTAKSILPLLVLIALFGVVVPWWRGLSFLDDTMVTAYACLSALFAAPYAVAQFSRDRPQTMGEAFRRIGLSVAYGFVVTLVILIAGLITVNLNYRRSLHLPSLDVLAEALGFGLLLALALSMLAGWMALRFSAGAARTGLRLVFFGVIAAVYYWPARLMEVALPGAGLALLCAAAMLWLLKREVMPA